MSIIKLDIYRLRCLEKVKLSLHHDFNFIYGPNGSGKTSILEAISLLSSGKSFKTREASTLIKYKTEDLILFAKTDSGKSVSMQKNTKGSTVVRIDGQNCLNSSELARANPCQTFYQDIFQILDAGPQARRQLLDWGMFHVKHSYNSLLNDYRHALKQRNALLRQKAKKEFFVPWDEIIVNKAKEIDKLRAAYVFELNNKFQEIIGELIDFPCTIAYYRGWDRTNTGKDLATILKEQFISDCKRQYTQYGIHNADLIIESSYNLAKKSLSRGEQKMVLVSIKLAQSLFLSNKCIYLFDDLTAELDERNVSKILAYLRKLEGQKIITTPRLELIGNMSANNYKIYDLGIN